MRFLSAIVAKLTNRRWVRLASRSTILVENEVAPGTLADAFVRAGRSGMQASASFNRMCEAMNRIGPAARVAGVSVEEATSALSALGYTAPIAGLSPENLEAMHRALDYGRPNVNISMTGMTGSTVPSVTQALPEPEPKLKKVRSLIRKIRFNGGSHDTTNCYAEFAKGTEARTRILSRRNANKVRKYCL